MLLFTPAPLPTLDKLGATIPAELDAGEVVQAWFDAFATSVAAKDTDAIANLLVEDSLWRDLLALTWDLRTFIGKQKIKLLLQDRLRVANPQKFRLKQENIGLFQPYPDLAWIQAFFTFETDVGLGSGIVRLVPTASAEWKAHTIFTNLEDLKGFPEKLGSLRDPDPVHGKWEENRRREVAFEGKDPTVLIVGGGQSGLDIAARLKCLGISNLVVERNPRIGDNWRNRYEALCLHDPVWYDHMPYLPFPSTWPVFAPARKIANWLESYAESLELNVWTSSTVGKVSKDPTSGLFTVPVKLADGGERVFKVNHVVFATGIGSGIVSPPVYPGMDEFQGQILHSTQHKKAADHTGKKVVVVGAGTSAHDICSDYYHHGVDVTMIQRSSTYIMSAKHAWRRLLGGLYSEDAPPIDVADRINASFPLAFIPYLNKRETRLIAEDDREILEGLKSVGFKLNFGYHDSGSGLLAWDKAGGYYIDVGASQLIIDGKIKLKSGVQIEHFTATGIKFDDGTELPADVVVFATGLGETQVGAQRLCDDDLASKIGKIWGLNEEGELNGLWRDIGVSNLWYMTGNLALCRFYSKHLALQIKAIEEGIFGTRYSITK